MKPIRTITVMLLLTGLTLSPGCARNEPVDQAQMRAEVRADIDQVMEDIAEAEEADPAIALSSNPYTYAELSPALDRLVARGEPALESIAAEIEDSPDNGLREYLLAIAGQRIMGKAEATGTWSNAKQWARGHRSRN